MRPSGEAIFSFSGPTKASSYEKAEWNAFRHLLLEISKKKWREPAFIIYSDYNKLLCKLADIFSEDTDNHDRWREIIRSRNIFLKLIPVDLNFKVDRLEKGEPNVRKWISFELLSPEY